MNETRLPPQSIEAEQAVLGSILLDAAECLPKIRRILAPAHFYRETHRIIYKACLDTWDARNAVDYVLVADQLQQEQHLDLVGGYPALTDLVRSVPSCIFGSQYAQVVKERALQRRAIAEAATAAAAAYEGPVTVQRRSAPLRAVEG